MRNLCLIAIGFYLALTAVTQVLLTGGPGPGAARVEAPRLLARR